MPGANADNIRRSILKTQLLLNEIRDLHAADDILNFGVPMEVDTGANESGHKPTKKAAMLTQRIEEKFNLQTAQLYDANFRYTPKYNPYNKPNDGH